MVFIPLKWLPWLLLIAGIGGLFTGEEDVGFCIGMAVVGGIWLFFRHSVNGTSNADNRSQTTSDTTPVSSINSAVSAQTAKTAPLEEHGNEKAPGEKPEVHYRKCPWNDCGYDKNPPDSVYCEKCGRPL